MASTPMIDSLESFERTLNRAQTFAGTPHKKSASERAALEHRKIHAERILYEWACQERPDTAGTKAALAAYGWKCDFRAMRGNIAELEDVATGRLHDVEF